MKPNKYIPAGKNKNVRDQRVGSTSNPEQINKLAANFSKGSGVKTPADPASITSIKLERHIRRAAARDIKNKKGTV